VSTQSAFHPLPARGTEVELFSVAGVDGYLREVNERFASLLGVDAETLNDSSMLELVHPDDLPEVIAGLAALEAGATEVMLENRFQRHGGGWTHLQWVARPIEGTDLWWAAGRDTTPFHQLVSDGVDLRARLDLAVGQATAAMWELDVKGGLLTWEPQAASLLGVKADDLPSGLPALATLANAKDSPAVAGALTDLVQLGRTDIELSIGEDPAVKHLALRGKVLERDRRGRALRAVGLLFDLTTEKAMEEQMLRMVMSDALTGAPNRRAFDQILRSEWRRCARTGDPLSIVMIDIDNFKSFNDTFGHLIGDEVLTAVSRALTTHLDREGDSVTRFGGEEFAVVLPAVDSTEALSVAERLCAAVRGVDVRQAPGWGLSVSVGVATWRPENSSMKSPQLLSRADQALYVAKSAGKDRAVSYETALGARAALEAAIASGMEAGEFEMHYQPVIVLGTGEVAGFEALMRWNRPGEGLVAPDAFIPVAEKSDLICDVGRFALQQATAQLVSWIDAGVDSDAGPGTGAQLTVAVNLSARHVADPQVVADVAAALEASGLAPERLEVELTETALADGVLVGEHLAQLRLLGVSVSIDDFGTGSTSVGQLPTLPVDTLKIDRSFIASTEPRQRSLVTLMIGAAHAFDLRVIAEGTEEVTTLQSLVEEGCDRAQGYAIARPMPASAVPAWVADWAPPRLLTSPPVARATRLPVV
jgi:diguanylate cyclase (GGDEF)-like protein/PAS domain S-box-containing protein